MIEVKIINQISSQLKLNFLGICPNQPQRENYKPDILTTETGKSQCYLAQQAL